MRGHGERVRPLPLTRMAKMYVIPIVLLSSLAGGIPQGRQLEVTMYRSWYPPNVTVVDGLFRVDGDLLGTGPDCAYHVTLSVVDDNGNQLVKNDWDGTCPPAHDGEPVGALETFHFAVVPAHYVVHVAVTPKGQPQHVVETDADLESLREGVLASDLILGRRVGWVDSTTTAQYSIKKGQLGIAAASEIVAQDSSPSIAYYMEVYPPEAHPLSGTLYGVILRPDGHQMARIKLQTVDSVAQARPLAGNMSVEGLATGVYVLQTRLELEDTVLVRTHPFRMEGKQFAQPEAAGAVTGYFATISPEDLAALFDPVVMTMSSQAQRDLYSRLNVDGKRRYLYQYFGGLEPSAPGEEPNNLDGYLERVRFVNGHFGGRRGEEAWKSDRGRIYMLRGAPSTRVQKAIPSDGAPPYEVWQYANAPGGYVYAFSDEGRMGAFRLVYSTDPVEPTLPDWDRRLAAEAVEEMQRMGVTIRAPGG